MIEEGLRREVGVFRGGLNGVRIGILLSDQFQLPVAALRELLLVLFHLLPTLSGV